MRNIFLQKSYRKWGRKASPRPFHEKSKLHISLDQQSEMFVFIVCPSRGLTKYIKTKVLTTCCYLM